MSAEQPQPVVLQLSASPRSSRDDFRQAWKPLLDALEERGGIGMIRDDGPEFIPEPVYAQGQVHHLADEHVEIHLEARKIGIPA